MENSKLIATEAMTWDVDGEEFLVVRPGDVPQSPRGQVRFLQQLLECSEREAEYARQVIMEDGEFIVSVQGDIDSL
jgi:hypothetical protein